MIARRSRSHFGRAVSAWPFAMRYGFSLAVIFATTGLIVLVNSEWLFLDRLTIENPTIYIASVALVAVLVGAGPAVLAAAASMLAVFLVFSRYESFERAVVLVATTLIIIGLAEWQHRAQSAAEQAQAKFAAIIESMNDAVMVVDRAGQATDLNHAAVAMLGATDRADALARLANRRADGTPITDEYGLLERALAGEAAPQRDVPIPDAPGGPRIAGAVASPIRDMHGRVIGAVSVSRDMTDRLAQTRERDALLRRIEQEQQFTVQVLANVPVGIAVVRADDFTVLSFNNEYDTSIRRAPGSHPLTIGRSLLDAMPAASHDAATHLLARARDEGATIHNLAYAAAIVPDQFYDGTIQPLQLGDGTPALLITAVNVTERVRGEREREQLLRTIEQEQQYTQLILDTAPVAIGVVRPDDLMVASANDVFETYISELAGEPFAAGASLMDALPGYESSEFVRQLRAAATEGRTLSVTGYAARFPEGRYYDWTMKPLAFGDERRATLVTFADVTERMRAEQERERLLALVEERRQFTQAIFDVVPVCLAVVDTDAMVFSAANPAYIAAIPERFHDAGVGGRSLTTILPHTAENGFVAQLRATGRTGEPFEALATEYAHPTRGVTYWNETMIPLTTRDPDAHHVLYIAADVTEEIEAQRRVAAHAREAAERASQLEAVFAALTEGLILTDAERTIVRSNAAVARVLGLDDAPLPPLDTFGERFAMRDQEGVPIPQRARAAIAALQGETRTDQLRRFRNARGAECWMSVSTVPVRDETDAITGVVLTMRDVTEERRGIEERERLLQEVEQRERFTQAIFDSVPVGLMVVGVEEGVVRTANDAYAHFMDERFAGADLAGRKAALLQPTGATTPLPENAEEQYLSGLRNLVAGGVAVTVREFSYPDYPGRGETFWDLTGVPLIEADGVIKDVLVVTVDATEQTVNRRAVEELAKTAAQRAAELETVITNMPDGVAIYAPDGRLLQMNTMGRQIVGQEPVAGEMVTEAIARSMIRDLDGQPIPFDDLPLARALRGETVSGCEFVSHTQHGDTWFLSSSAPITGADGEITSAIVMFTDITERKRAEQEREQLLREVEERRQFAQTVIDSALTGIAVCAVDPDFTVLLANEQFRAIVGDAWAQPRLDGVPFHAFTPNAESAGILPIFRRVMETGESVTLSEFEYAGSGDHISYFDWSLVPLRASGDAVTGLVLLVTDVTDRVLSRQRIEELADAAEQRAAELEAIIANMPDGVAIYGADGRLRQMNRAGREISGEDLSPDDALPDVVEHFQLRYPDGRLIPLDDLPLPRALRGETASGYEFISRTRRGDRNILTSSAPITSAMGAMTGAVVVFSDITERRRTEEMTTRLGRILDASSNEIYVYDAGSLHFLQVNAGAQRNLGYMMEELAQMTPLDIRPAFTAESFAALIAPLRAGERDEIVFETAHRRKDGSDYPVEARLRLSRSENPPVFVSIVQDITERYTAEQQREQLLREIDERRRFVQTVVESAPVGIAVFGTDVNLTARMVNDQYLQLLGASWHDTGIIDHGVRAFVPGAEAAGLTALARQVIEQGETIALREFAFDGFANGMGYFDASIVPLRESGAQVTGVLTVVADVTERVQSRERIEELAWDAAQRASELETVIASIADGVMVTDAEGRIVLENAAARQLMGRTESAFSFDLEAQVTTQGLRDADGAPLLPDDLPLGRAVRGETVAEQVVIVRRADTEEDRFMMCSSAPVRAGNNAITGAVAVFRDITEMKQIDQMKDEFISIAAHELRTPLTAIKGYAELLERRLSMQTGRENDRRSLGVIRKQTERLAGLVNEMLDVSRIEAGRLQLNNESFDLSALVGEVVANMRITGDAHALSLAAEPGVVVHGDTARIEQVLLNLITNAISYAPQGGEIAIRVWTQAGAALVAVRDQGMGIAADELPHLFDRFYRAPHAEAMRSGGMGLGLYISREIIVRHGGTIWAESSDGAGSTFTFSLPLAGKD